MKILISGVNGFVGRHLARELKNRSHEVFGVGREDSPSTDINELLSGYTRCDLTDQADVAAMPLEGIEGIINLAGLANVGDSFNSPDSYNRINVEVLAILGRRLVNEKNPARILAISTGAVYKPEQALPLTEDSATTMESSPYAQSKLLMEQAVAELSARGLNCAVLRPFNHIGPGQEPGFLVPDLYAKIESALQTGQPVEVGNLQTKRDYTDVRDVVKAYAGLVEQPKLSFDLYNVCSAKSIAGQEILKQLLGLTAAEGKVQIKVNPQFVRPNDPLELYGSSDRLQKETGWTPTYSLEQTLKDFVLSKS